MTLHFWLDFASTYSYPAAMRMRPSASYVYPSPAAWFMLNAVIH